jgi:hypothetical protein
MRTIACLLVFLLLESLALAQDSSSGRPAATRDEQSGYCPRTHNLEADPSAEYWLEGAIGSKTVKMYLDRGGSGVVGLFYEPDGDWKPVLLGGEWRPNGIDLTAGTDSSVFDSVTPALPPLGHLQGQLADRVFVGQWTATGENHPEPVHLSVVPKAGCAGSGEWTRFDSRKWPFSFSYPASWKLVEETEGRESYIRLVCLDPEEMAYDADVWVSEGLGDPSASKETRLVRCGSSWRYNVDCNEDIRDSVFNLTPTESMRHGMRILDISDGHEWRTYCRNGGYVGQGDGKDLVVLLKNGWIEVKGEHQPSDIVDRIVDTIRPQAAK